MPAALHNVVVFVISTLISLYVLALILRTLLALVRADFYNPISQFLVTVTNPPLRVLRRFIPPMGKFDTSAVVLIIALKMLELWLVAALSGVGLTLPRLFAGTLLQLLQLIIYIYIFTIIIEAVMSWFLASGARHNPLAGLLRSLNRPILAPIRRTLPQIGMVDLSPLVAIIGLNVILILLRSL